MFNRVAILGLGLIGGSMGLALRKARAAQEVVGFDLGQGVAHRAYKMGAIDQPYRALADAIRGAELVVLATPVGAMYSLLQEIAAHVTPGAIVTDVASTKVQVIKWAEEILPASISFIGGHPMAGKELSGVEAADATLFHNCIYCMTPTANTKPGAVSKVCSLIETLGARVRFLEPTEHDREVASVSHLPFLASVALVETVSASASWHDASLLAANGFRDISRLAAGSPEMYRDICLTNSEVITRWLDEYIAILQNMRDRIASCDSDITENFAHAREVRLQWEMLRQTNDVKKSEVMVP